MFERDQPLGISNNDDMWENISCSPTDGFIENNNVNLEKVCRDYLRNLCRRGKRCKFHHPVDRDSTILCSEYTFCHDYQNSSCNRSTCRFVHGTIEEETYYKKTGELPSNVLDHVIRNGIVPDVPAGVRVCKDYLKGECRRGGKCKFRHLTVRQYETEMFAIRNKTIDLDFESPETKRSRFTEPNTLTNMPPHQQQVPPPLSTSTAASAAAAAAAAPSNHHILIRGNKTLQAVHCYPALSASDARSIVIEEENSILRKKVEALTKQVSDLTATNEFLLDQNAQLRMMGGKRANVTAVTVPAVTITNTGASGMQVQPLTQIQPATVTAGALRTVTASVATVPVPVSIAAVSMAPVQISPPVVTVAQQTLTVETAPGPPGDAGPPQGPPGTAPPSLVSYPIMSQELRPVLQTSLSH